MPTVANRHHFGKGRWPDGCMYVGRPSSLSERILRDQLHVLDGTALGNPYKPDAFESPQDCLDAYKRWLWDRVSPKSGYRQPKVIAALEAITEDTILVCSCAPRPCHADVLVALWGHMKTEEWNGVAK